MLTIKIILNVNLVKKIAFALVLEVVTTAKKVTKWMNTVNVYYAKKDML